MEKIDVCICTRNRPVDLRRCIESVLQSEVEVNKIIVSDDSTNDSSKLMIAGEFPAVSWTEGPRRGLGANRNNAISLSDGDFIIFLDDDAMLNSQFIANAMEYFRTHNIDPKRTIITGIEINNGREVKSNDQSFLGYQSREYAVDQALNTLVINSAIIPAEIAKALQFDELLVYGSDEVDFALRARAAGITIVFCPNLKNLHFPSAINRAFYSPFVDSSRIYVTFKRYCLLEKRLSKAWWFLLIASLHLIIVNLNRSGLKGIVKTWSSLQKAYGFIGQFLSRSAHARIYSGS